MFIRMMKWPGTIQYKVWIIFLLLVMVDFFNCTFIMHYYIALHCITMHYLPLCILQSSSISYCAASDIRVVSTKPYTIHHPATQGTKHHTTHPPHNNNHVRCTLIIVVTIDCFVLKCTHWHKLCVCTAHCLLQTEDFWLGVCQWCDDSCCRGFWRKMRRRGSFWGVWLIFAGWCVLYACCWCCATNHWWLHCYCWSCDVYVIWNSVI